MRSPFTSQAFERATARMFDELVVITSVEDGVTRSSSVRLAIFDDAETDAMSDVALDSEIERIRALASESDWAFISLHVGRGASIRRADGRVYSICGVRHDAALGRYFTARLVK